MASDQTLRAIITVLDKTVEPIHAINARFHALSLPLHEIGSRIGEFAEETGLKAIGEHAGEALEHVRHLGEGLAEMAGPLAALGAVGSIAGLVEMAKSTGEFAEKLDLAAGMTGMATEQLAGWHYAAQLANIDVERFDRGLTYLNRSISDAASGKAKDVQQILSHMGFHNTQGHLVGTGDALRAIAAEVKHLVDGGQIQLATAMMAKLFGERTGAQLLPLFEKGPEELAKTLQEAQEAGISLTAAQSAGGHAFMESYKAMTASVEGLKIAIGSELFPVLTPIIEATREWLNANRAWLASGIRDAVTDLASALRGIDWEGIGSDIGGIARSAAWVVREIGGIGPAIAVLAGISVAPMIAEFGQLGFAVAAASTKLLLFPAAQAIASFASLVPAISSARDVWAAFDIVLDANPLGVAVLAIGALAGAGYELYQHWSGVVAFFRSLWDSVAGIFEGAWKHIEPIVHTLQEAGNWFGKHFGGGGAGAAAGGMTVDPTTGMMVPLLGTQPSLPALTGAAAAAGGGPGQKGQTNVTVDFKNLPQGASVKTESRGTAPAPDVNVGYAMALSGL